MAIPDYQSLMLPVLEAGAQGEARIGDVVEALAEKLGLTDEERAELLPSGKQTTFANRVHWAKTYLGKAGLVALTRRAHFKTTDRGLAVLQKPPDRITINFLEDFPGFKDFIGGSPKAEADGVKAIPKAEDQQASADNQLLTPDEEMRRAHKNLEDALAESLIARIQAASPTFFERLIVNLLLAMGYGGTTSDIAKALIGKSGDGGVDGVIDQDPLGLDRIYVQAKRYADGNSVGAGAIRDFFGALDHFKAAKGLFVTTSTFSIPARTTAEMLSKRIVLLDGPQLARLMIRHNVGCRIVETLHLKEEDEEFFETS